MINDDVLATVLNMSIVLIATWTSLVKTFTVGEAPLHYYICAGIDPNKGEALGTYQSHPKKYNASLFLVIGSSILHLVLLTKIFLFQWKSEKKVKPIELGDLGQQRGSDRSEKPIATISYAVETIRPPRQIR